MLFSSLYFYPSEYALPYYLKDTLIEAPIVRGKIFETSILALNNFKTIILGTGWGVVPDLLLENIQ